MKNTKKIGKWIAIGILCLFLSFSSFYIVPAGHTGILLQFGAVKGTSTEGLHFKLPVIQGVVLMDNRVQKVEAQANASSKDLQTVTSKIAVNYHVLPSKSSYVYQKVGLDYSDVLISPAIQESVKAITAQYTAEQLITKRQNVSQQVKDLLNKKMSRYGIVIDDFNITNFDFSEAFNNAIEAKLVAEQQALKAKNDLERIKIEAEQKITQAQAEAKALALQKAQVTPELIKLREIEVQKAAVEKWDGKLPNIVNGAIPFININDVSK